MTASASSSFPSSIRRLTPKVRMPSPETMAMLPDADVALTRARLSTPIECVYEPIFEISDAEEVLMGPPPAAPTPGDSEDSGAGMPTPEAGNERELHIFRRLNYCRYRIMCILRAARGRQLDLDECRVLVRWERATLFTRAEIVRANMPLVLAMARRTRIVSVDQFDLISEGNLALMRSVDKFDCTRGYRFSTYACRAILKSFSRVAVRSNRHRGVFPAEFDPVLERSDYLEQKRNAIRERCIDALREILIKNHAQLSDVEEQVIRARFALDDPPEQALKRGKTLEQVGELIGVTKERVRQIQNKALDKLKVALQDDLTLA